MRVWSNEWFGGLKYKMENNVLAKLLFSVEENRTLS